MVLLKDIRDGVLVYSAAERLRSTSSSSRQLTVGIFGLVEPWCLRWLGLNSVELAAG